MIGDSDEDPIGCRRIATASTGERSRWVEHHKIYISEYLVYLCIGILGAVTGP